MCDITLITFLHLAKITSIHSNIQTCFILIPVRFIDVFLFYIPSMCQCLLLVGSTAAATISFSLLRDGSRNPMLFYAILTVVQMRTEKDRYVIYLDVKHFSPEELSVSVDEEFITIHARHEARQVSRRGGDTLAT